MAAEDTDAGVDHGKSPDAPSVTVTEGILHKEDLLSVLGPPKFDGPRDNVLRVSKAGVAVGLAYTPVGGDVLYVSKPSCPCSESTSVLQDEVPSF
jgi:ATP-dependent Lon protease